MHNELAYRRALWQCWLNSIGWKPPELTPIASPQITEKQKRLIDNIKRLGDTSHLDILRICLELFAETVGEKQSQEHKKRKRQLFHGLRVFLPHWKSRYYLWNLSRWSTSALQAAIRCLSVAPQHIITVPASPPSDVSSNSEQQRGDGPVGNQPRISSESVVLLQQRGSNQRALPTLGNSAAADRVLDADDGDPDFGGRNDNTRDSDSSMTTNI
jgi:hypothetical protein